MNLQDIFKVYYEADKGGQGGSDPSDTNPEGGDNPDADPSTTDKTIPYSRFAEVNSNYKSVKEELDTLKQQQEQQQEDDKKKQGEFESLYNDLKTKHDPLSEEFTQYKETFQEILKTKMESVPEDMQDLIPQGNELEQLKWIENATAKGLFGKDDKVKDFGNQGGNPDTESNKNKWSLKDLGRF